MAVRQSQQESVIHVLREQESPFLGAGRTEIEPLTGERPEVFILAVGICAPNAGDTLREVPAENELLHYLCDALDSEPTVNDRVPVFVLSGESM